MLTPIDYSSYLDTEIFIHFNEINLLPIYFQKIGSIFDPIELEKNQIEIYKNIKYTIEIETQTDNYTYEIKFDDLDALTEIPDNYTLQKRYLTLSLDKNIINEFNNIKLTAQIGSESDPIYQTKDFFLKIDDIKQEYLKYNEFGFNNLKIFIWYEKALYEKIIQNEDLYPIGINLSYEDISNIYKDLQNFNFNYLYNLIRKEKCLNFTFRHYDYLTDKFNNFKLKDNSLIPFICNLNDIKNYNLISPNEIEAKINPILNKIKSYLFDFKKDYIDTLDYTKPEIKKLTLIDESPRVILLIFQQIPNNTESQFKFNFIFQQYFYDFY